MFDKILIIFDVIISKNNLFALYFLFYVKYVNYDFVDGYIILIYFFILIFLKIMNHTLC